MEKFKIAHYQKSGSMWFTNGGKLIVTENEYIVKYLFQTVARFEIDKTVASRCSDVVPLSQGIRLTDGIKEIDLYFFNKTAENLYKIFNIQLDLEVVILTSKHKEKPRQRLGFSLASFVVLQFSGIARMTDRRAVFMYHHALAFMSVVGDFY